MFATTTFDSSAGSKKDLEGVVTLVLRQVLPEWARSQNQSQRLVSLTGSALTIKNV